jgi:DNA (cytosine-5)-methyltransferase 1
VGAPLRKPILLCGASFGYRIYRHRLFESNVDIPAPHHRRHRRATSAAGHYKPRTIMSVAGHIAPISLAREIMDIDWMTREELRKAIQPYYTEYIGRHLIKALR